MWEYVGCVHLSDDPPLGQGNSLCKQDAMSRRCLKVVQLVRDTWTSPNLGGSDLAGV